MRKLRPAAFTTTGRDIANRARSAGAASSSAVTGGVVISTESATAPDGRSSCPSVRTIVSAAESRSSRLPGWSGTTWMRRPWRTSLALRGSLIHIRRDLVEHVLEGSVRHDEPRQHLRSEDARAEPPEATNRPESVSGSSGGSDRGVPVRLDRELVRREPVRARGSHEGDGMRRALLEQRVELRHCLALRQAADVDPRDPRARGELALGAGEREADEDGQERRRACRERERRRDRERTPSGAAARGVEG